MLYKHNFTPLEIWNKRCTLHKKSLLYKEWVEKRVWTVIHLKDRSGNIFMYTDFKMKFGINCPHKQFSLVVKAIPTVSINRVPGMLQYSHV